MGQGRGRSRAPERTPKTITYASAALSAASLQTLHALAGRAWPWWNGAGWPWALLWLLGVALFWGGLFALLVWAIRSSTAPRRRPDTAMETLRRRLAAGEITEEEFERIRRLISE